MVDTVEVKSYRTVGFSGKFSDLGRAGPDLYRRTAAAVLAFQGQGGEWMPKRPFAYLVGGAQKTTYRYHVKEGNLFESDEQVRVRPGYFIGTDGTKESCSDKKRIDMFGWSTEQAHETAKWMVGIIDKRPGFLRGEEKSKKF